MCGIIALVGRGSSVRSDELVAMADLIRHRGPDGEGFSLFPAGGEVVSTAPGGRPLGQELVWPAMTGEVGFGHRRLSIIDTSTAGHQPMSDEYGDLWVTYNGEIYNHLEVRAELESKGYVFHTNSDTEVLLSAWREWGRESLSRLNGMFAFVLFDRPANRLFAVRDRFGVKPLYWWRRPGGDIAVSSEIKAFRGLKDWRAVLNHQMGYEFLAWGLSDHTTETFFQGVHQVPAGGLLEIELLQEDAPVLTVHSWFTLGAVGDAPETIEEASEMFREKFTQAVALRLRADVPVGTALSGGLDSSSIVCTADRLLHARNEDTLNAFSARSTDPQFDEGPYMQSVVDQTNVNHHVTWPDADGFLEELDNLIWHHDEPFSSASIYAQWKVFAKVAETPVKVTLDGHGADEALIGYTAYIGPNMASMLKRGEIGTFLSEWRETRRRLGHSRFWLVAMIADSLLPYWLRQLLRRLSGKAHASPDWLNMGLLNAFPNDPFAQFEDKRSGLVGMSMAQLTATSLPMQLKWGDRDSMAHSIESREPFLDPDLIGFVLALPDRFKLSMGVTKRVLRLGMGDRLPSKVVNRRDKMGFVTPESQWVKQDRPDEFLAAARRAIEDSKGILTDMALRDATAMTKGDAPFHNRLIRILTFGTWMRQFEVNIE